MVNYSLDGVFHALADPTRRTMVDRMAQGPATVSELAAPLATSLPTVLAHLAVLEKSGLVVSHKHGRVRCCRLREGALDESARWIEDRRARWRTRLNALDSVFTDSTEGHDHDR